jgi:uncharacterized protein
MSEENVEIVRRVFDAVTRRDTETVLALYDPEVEWDVSRSAFGKLLGQGVYRGHDGLRTFFRQWYEAWEKPPDNYDELIDAGDQVVSVVTERGRGRASGIELELTQYGVWTVREGTIVRGVWFAERAQALEAAGLSE